MGFRIVTAAVGIPVVLAVNYAGGWPFAVLIDVAAVVGAIEACRLMGIVDAPEALLSTAAVAVIATLPMATDRPERSWIAVLLAVLAMSGARSLLAQPREGEARDWLRSVFPALYIGLPLGLIHLLRHASRGAWWIAVLLLITWAYDTGAFAAGSRFGRRPFMQHISARKTREGVAGGLIPCTLTGLIAVPAVGIALWQALLLGLAGGVAAQIGDLVESAMKRRAGVKDSGTVVPGHGGLLDRIDSLLWTGPLVYAVTVAVGHAS